MFLASDGNSGRAINAWKAFYGSFYVAQFNSVAANLDSVVLTATEFEQPLRIHPRPVARFHQPRSGAVQVGGKPLRGKFGVAPVTVCHVSAPDNDFTDLTLRD